MTNDVRSAVPAIDRADKILHLLASASAPLRPLELAKQSGLAKSTLYLLLDALEQHQWIEKTENGYIIGIELYALGATHFRHDGLQNAFRAAAADFVTEHNEVVQMAVLDGTDVVYLGREDARRPVRLVSDIGMRLPAHSSGLGKVLLAQLSEQQLLERLPVRLAAVTDKTITQRETLLRVLDDVRVTGLGRDDEETTAGLVCFAIYVGETALGRKIAVSTSIPKDRLNKKREKRIVQSIVRVARQISDQMGMA